MKAFLYPLPKQAVLVFSLRVWLTAFHNKSTPFGDFRTSVIICPSLLNPLSSENFQKDVICEEVVASSYRDHAGLSMPMCFGRTKKCPRAPTSGGRDGKTMENKGQGRGESRVLRKAQ